MKKHNKRGITLVALVITVIVLLIIAGVSISLLTGGEGLFSKAKEAADKYNNVAENEEQQINQLVTNIENARGEKEPESDGNFAKSKGVNTPDTSKLPMSTTKYVTWTGTNIFTENLSDTVPTD